MIINYPQVVNKQLLVIYATVGVQGRTREGGRAKGAEASPPSQEFLIFILLYMYLPRPSE